MSCNFPLILGLYIENNGTMKDLGIINELDETCYSYKVGKNINTWQSAKLGSVLIKKCLPSPLLNPGYAFALRDFKDVPLKLFKKWATVTELWVILPGHLW